MLRLALVALLATSACRISLDDGGEPNVPDGGRQCNVVTTTPTCVQAETNQSLGWIEQNIFTPNCGGTSCHGQAPTPGGRIVLTVNSHANLVNVASTIEPDRMLVVPGNINQSYLMVLLRHITPGQADPPASPPPEDPGYMPQNSPPICCQKLDAITRWIEGGALDD